MCAHLWEIDNTTEHSFKVHSTPDSPPSIISSPLSVGLTTVSRQMFVLLHHFCVYMLYFIHDTPGGPYAWESLGNTYGGMIQRCYPSLYHLSGLVFESDLRLSLWEMAWCCRPRTCSHNSVALALMITRIIWEAFKTTNTWIRLQRL